MTDFPLIFPFLTHDFIEADGRQVEEEAMDLTTPRTGYMPAAAQCFQVRSLQHWIDLCA
jgi:hypothetical protein